MSLCPKCIIGGVLQGGSRFDYDEAADADAEALSLHIEFDFELETDDEQSQGSRHVEFDGTLAEGTRVDGLLRGTLKGNFDVVRDQTPTAEAIVETFESRGMLAFVSITVPGPFAGPSFSANLRPGIKSLNPAAALREVTGTVFLGWDDPGRAS